MRPAAKLAHGAAICLLAASLLSCSRDRAQTSAVEAAAPVAPLEITCLGRIVPGEGIIKVAAPASAIIRELKVVRGASVRKGDILAYLNDHASAAASLNEAELQVGVAESGVRQAMAPGKPASIAAQQAALARQELVLKNAEAEQNRKAQLFKSKLISAADFEAASLTLETARETLHRETELLANEKQVREVDVEVMRKRLAAANAARDRAAAEVEQQVIRAPLTGTVLEIYARSGENPGAQGILDLGDTRNMFVEAEVYATDIRRVHEGAGATISGEAFEGNLTGRVSEILREAGYNALFPADPSNAADKRVIRVRIRLDDGGKVRLLNNSQVVARIHT